MTGMREQIARAYFERDKASNLMGLQILNGSKTIRHWPRADRVQRGAIIATAWEDIQQRDRNGYYATADVALACLEKPTDGMVSAGSDVGLRTDFDEEGRSVGSAAIEVFAAMLKAAREGK